MLFCFLKNEFVILLRCPLDSILDPLWFQWIAFPCHMEKMTMDISVWRAKTAPASSVALKTAEQDRGGKGGCTYALPKLIPILEYFSQQLLPCSTWSTGLATFTCKFYLIGKTRKKFDKIQCRLLYFSNKRLKFKMQRNQWSKCQQYY